MENCPCGSNQSYAQCCQTFHNGDQFPATAEALMRSRYSAFVNDEIDYIMDTFHKKTRSEIKRDDIANWASSSSWKGLTIVNVEAGQESDSTGVVEFKAKYEASGKQVEHHEKSHFDKIDGRWYFVDGEIVQETHKREGPKVGRNDPCPCGSGKKYKKCCL